MKKIMIDMDDVIVFVDFMKMIEDFVGHKVENPNNDYYLDKLFGDKRAEFFSKFANINLYDEAVLMNNCYDTLKELNDKYDIYICTTYVWEDSLEGSSSNLKNKYDYLLKELPFIHPNKYIFTSHKELFKADIKIDDRIENLENSDTKLLFTAWHNQKFTTEELKSRGVIRVNNWLDIKDILINKNRT